MTSAAEAQLAAQAGADLVGLVGPMPSGPGTLTLTQAREIALAAPAWVDPVLLTSASAATAIEAQAAQAGAEMVQVVTHIAADEAARLTGTALTYIQVIHVEDAAALDLIPVYAPHVDAFLLDSGRPGLGELGGTGRLHDWEVSADFVRRAAPVPVFLAGGLTPENVVEAILKVRPFGVDVCSGLRPDGTLDGARLQRFVAAVGTA
ncbi:MAG: phosphoribosylanthranilate isomerase [Pikeienuella sp.]